MAGQSPHTTMKTEAANSTNAATISSGVSNHRKMMAMPALKILGDLDHSEKSFDVLMAVMDRCCREPNNQGVFLGCGKDENEHKLAFAFTKWFLGRFAIIFTRKSYMKAFTPFIELNVKILNLFRDKEPNQFANLINEYASLLKELSVIVSKQSTEEVCGNLSIKLHSFVAQEPISLGADCLLTMEGLELGSLLECSLLQNNITKIVALSAEGILQYDQQLCEKLTCILLDQLNYGGVEIFKVTLECLGRILILDYPAKILEVFLSYAYRLVNLLMDTSNKSWASTHEDNWKEIGVALTECLSRISNPYGSCSVTNHQYLRLISFILLHQQFHQPFLLDNLLQSMLGALQRFTCPETISLCRFTPELWVQLLGHSNAAIPPLLIILQSEMTPFDWSMEAGEPSAKRPKFDFLPMSTSSTLWDQLKTRWLQMLDHKVAHHQMGLTEVTILIRIAVTGAKLKLKWREMSCVLDDANFIVLNERICEILLNNEINNVEVDSWIVIISEYLSSCIPLSYAGIDKSVALEWFALSALPWLSAVSESCDLDNKWIQVSRKFKSSLLKRQSSFASCFVKFPVAFFKPWAIDIGMKILDMEFLQADAEALIPSLPWIVRHSKAFRESISQCLTTILASGSREEIRELTKNGADLVCALSGKINVVNHPEGGLSLRCTHNLENLASSLKVSIVPDEMLLFFLEFVFDENDHSVLHRVELFLSVLYHSGRTEALRSAVIKKLHKVAQISIDKNFPSLQRAILKCTTILVQFWKETVMPDCFHVLFKILLLSAYTSPVMCWASSTIKEIASKLNTTTEMLFQRHVTVVCDVLLSNPDLEWRNSLLSLAPEIFMSSVTQTMSSTSQLLTLLLPTLIPRLVLERSKGPSPFLEEICSQMNKTQSELIVKYFSDIYVYTLLHCDATEQRALMPYLERTTKLKILQLRAPNFQSVHNDLVIQLHSQRDRVLEALRLFADEDKNSSTVATPTSATKNRGQNKHLDSLGDYLRPRFLGILVHLDSVLLSKVISDKIKIEALSSLSDLLHLMGAENIIAVRLKVLATLRTALQLTEDPFPQLNASAWDAFVRILGVQELGPLVSQIAVSVLPLHSSCAEQIRAILYYIVVENSESLKEHLKDLHFLPELPGLEDVVYSLKKTCSTNSSVPEQLSVLMSNISHQDFDVRMQSLRHLKSIVQKNFDAIQQLIMGTNDTSEAVMTRLISALLKGCSVREEELLLLYGKCFGYLGAVDPGRLSFSDYHHGDSTNYTAALIDDDFTFHLLDKLARSFLAPRNSQTLSILSFTIQQILKIYNSEEDPSKLFSTPLWARLPEQLRVAFAPLTSSRYVLKLQTETGPAPFPVYRSAAGKTYGNWLYNWTAELIGKVTHPLAQQIFKACLPTLRRDQNVNLHLLPYVVITALWSSSAAEASRIGEEIMAVLTDRGLQRSPRRMMKRYSSNASTPDVSSQGSGAKDSADVNLHQSSVQGIFNLLDHLKKWLKKKASNTARKDRSFVTLDEYKVVQELVDRIPNDLLARASHQCQAYARAILHLEIYLKSHPDQLRDQLGFLQKLYVAVDEPDGVAGVCAIRDQEPSLEENITAYEATGRLQDAFSCYERISQREDCSLEFYQGMLRCLTNLDLPQGALTMANGLLQNCPDWRSNLDDYRAECCWRLGQWEMLEDVVKPYDSTSNNAAISVGWGVGLGQALLATKNNKLEKMESHLRSVRLKQMRVISAVNLERNSYQRVYENVVKLHILSELESAVSLLDPALISKEAAFRTRFAELLKSWGQRLDGVQASVRYTEPILNVRRVVLKLIGQQVEDKFPNLTQEIEAEIGKSWLVSARLARKSSHFQRAHILQLVASTSPCPPPAIYMEQAKLHWMKGEQDQAITVLKRGLEKRFPDLVKLQTEAAGLFPNNFTSDIFECLKAKLLLARYYDETGNADMNTIIKYYREVTEISKFWEDGWFQLAGYYDRVWTNLPEKEGHLDMARYIIANLGRSMVCGSQFIYQAMPRMLSLWMELGTIEAENPKVSKNPKIKFTDLSKAIDHAQEKIPPYKFLTAFPQLISRICHPHPEVTTLLRRIIAKTVLAHPQQCMWMMISVLKSSHSVRVKRCRDILENVATSQPRMRSFFSDATNLADRLVELANKPVDDGITTLSVEKVFRSLPRLLSQPQFSKIMMPLQWSMTVTLPTTLGENIEHNPFPRDPVYIVGIEDTVEIMHSLQKPKKISLRGSDGKLYLFLCKPQDDLRKDFRLMEFNQLVNRYLVRDPESRKRNLHIRTYGVVPLNEDCGLIEWIPNLIGLRIVLTKIYKEKGLGMSQGEMKKKIPHLKETILKKRELFEKEFLTRYPSVFSEWFLSTFPDPQDWFSARLNYVRTTAVMSMVGFIVGLGDRHGENILYDSVCGDTVHVDFSCLFNKGLSFEWPEQVPFRLTHNMIEAMGSTGIEGSFRKCCEVTLRVLRTEIDTLLSVLKPFVHDPLLEWSKKSGNKGRTDLGEIKNEQALEHVGNIEARLQGLFLQSKSNKMKYKLSVEGQVNQLIAEATNHDNLCQMYIGWAAYL